MDLFEDKPTKGKKVQQTKVLNRSNKGSSGSFNGGGSSDNELVQKVVSNIKGNKSDNSIDYITRNNKHEHEVEEFISPEDEMGNKLSRDDLEALKKEWRDEFSEDNKIKTRNMTHIVLSVDVEDSQENRNKLQNAAREYLAERFAEEGFRYVFVQHNDTDKPHVHVMVNNNNLETNKKLRISVDWHYESRLMFKEHLKNNGINQEATFKKERQMMKEKERSFEKLDQEVTHWFDAKLKQVSQNDKHLEHLKRQFSIVQELKKEMQQSERFSTQKQLELSERVKTLRGDIVLHDRFTSRTEANKAVHSMIKEIDPPRQTLLKAVERNDQKNEQAQTSNEKKYQRQLYFHAKELVKAEAILKSTSHTSSDKKEALKQIKVRKAFLASKGIDVKKLEQDHRADLSTNEKFKITYRVINKVIPQTNKQLKKDKALDHEATNKRFVRMLDAHQRAKSDPSINDTDKKTLDTMKANVLIDLESKGFPAKKALQNWSESRALKTAVKELKEVIQKSPQQAQEHQKQLFMLKKQLEQSPLDLINKKERFTLALNLRKAQEQLNKSTQNDFEHSVKTIDSVNRSFKTLDTKISDGDKKKVRSQAYAMTATIVSLKDKTNLLPSQQKWVDVQIQKIDKEFSIRKIDFSKNQEHLTKSNTIHQRVNEFKGQSMNRLKAKGYSKSEQDVNELKNEVKGSALAFRTKRELSKQLNAKNQELQEHKLLDRSQLTEKMNQIEKLVKNIERLNKPQNVQDLTALERLNNQRQINAYANQLNELVVDAKKLTPSLDTDKKVKTNKYLSNLQKTHAKGIERSR
ncbi:hypothetical protein BCT75_04175 [Vibrio lentus]|uniref:relaxase/mobilization nuclease domain-containing protein n=1 Tax=Vibrio lentus TaxID=136468 RepID=UPI000C8440A2|nr:relaxase/mobilization nuclease domain-containing protein [Vibrio lentus]PML45586.1 hypothetical protein BCT75_04175 [Vibrio lentus]